MLCPGPTFSNLLAVAATEATGEVNPQIRNSANPQIIKETRLRSTESEKTVVFTFVNALENDRQWWWKSRK
jgi:hypothetical protein